MKTSTQIQSVKKGDENLSAVKIPSQSLSIAERQTLVFHTSRKKFAIVSIDKRSAKDKEMQVFTHTKKLSEYIFKVTEKSPKKYRWSVVHKLHETITEVLENLYYANFEPANRLQYQNRAKVKLCLLEHFVVSAKNLGCINMHQMQVMALALTDIQKMLAGWQKATKQKMTKN